MYYCTELCTLSLLSLYEGEMLGRVDRLWFDKKLKRLSALEIIGESDTRLILPAKKVYHIGKNAITVRNNLAVSLKVEDADLALCPLGSKAYSIRGEYLGNVRDVRLDEKFSVEAFLLDNEETLSPAALASCGRNTIIFYEKEREVNVHKFTPAKTPRLFKNLTNRQTAKILPLPHTPVSPKDTKSIGENLSENINETNETSVNNSENMPEKENKNVENKIEDIRENIRNNVKNETNPSQKMRKTSENETKKTGDNNTRKNFGAVSVDESKPAWQNAEFLIGRICTKDIYNFNRELLIKAHSPITKKHLKEANKYGKLRELMLFSH